MRGFAGILQVDGYSAYAHLANAKAGTNETVTLAGCWAHLRCRFYELHINGTSRIATQSVTLMAGLWKVEDEIRGQDPAARAASRQKRSAAIVAELFALWETELRRIPGKSKLAETIRYAIARRQALERFIVERTVRPQTIVGKNAILAGSDGGGRIWATIATLLQTCRMNDVDPFAWLTQTLERITDRWPISQLDQLMPWNFKS